MKHWPWQHKWSVHPDDPFIDVCECGKMRQIGDQLQNYFPVDLLERKEQSCVVDS